MDVKITFDPPKNARSIRERGYDFDRLTTEFFQSAVIIRAKQGRLNALGMFDGKLVSVIFKPLGTQGLSVISMRRASTRERKLHDSEA